HLRKSGEVLFQPSPNIVDVLTFVNGIARTGQVHARFESRVTVDIPTPALAAAALQLLVEDRKCMDRTLRPTIQLHGDRICPSRNEWRRDFKGVSSGLVCEYCNNECEVSHCASPRVNFDL